VFTLSYKNWFIHGWCDREEVRVQSPDFQFTVAKSVFAAKAFITKRLGG
jgi:predicted secreted protein